MHILHALFSGVPGGLEQSYVDITEALVAHDHRVTALLRHDAPYRQAVAARASAILMAKPRGFYDIPTAWYIRGLLKKLRPDLILAHNARAISLLATASHGLNIPICGVSHSYKTARTIRANALITLTEHMRQHFVIAGFPVSHIAVIPNMIRLPDKPAPRTRRDPVIIGAIGRMSSEKGFADMLEALKLLKQREIHFAARIAGEGPELTRLKAQAETLGIAPHIEWKGWVSDKAAFYRGIDILCVPSREESFGLVVLEGLSHGVPVVATDAPGPSALITSGKDGLIVSRNNPQALAEGLQKMIEQPGLGIRFAAIGWQTAERYDFDSISKLWDEAVIDIIAATAETQAA